MYQPKALLWHKVPASRISKSWLCKRIFAGGVTSAIMAETAGSNPNRLHCLARGLKTGLKGILYSFRLPIAAIVRGGENNIARINTIIHLFGLTYQSLRMALGQGLNNNEYK
jgi:hypothetical protein